MIAAAAAADDPGGQAEAWLGSAAALRVKDRLDAAQELLDRAEAVLPADGMEPLRSRICHLRGNIAFPLGRVEQCLAQHSRALELAEQAGSPELVALALGGMGDAHYAQGRYLTALASYERCVAIAAEHGFGRIEVANRSMIPISRGCVGPLHGAFAEARLAVEAAARVGHRRAEIVACHSAFFACAWQHRLEEADAYIDRAEELTAQIGAFRFRAENMAFRAEIARLAGRRGDAARMAAAALADSEATAPYYLGPAIAGFLAAAAEDAATRERALDTGERLLAGTALRHNHYLLFMGAIEGCLEGADWDRATSYANRLAKEFSVEPMPYVELLATRGRALASWGRGDRSAGARADLVEAAREAEELGYLWLVPRLREALG